MKLMIVALALVAAVAAAPSEKLWEILRSDFDMQPQGDYKFGFDTENGISRSEVGELKTVNDEENKPHSVITMRGSYTYLDAEGKPQTIEYYADESGYHATGPAIPQLPARR